MKNIHAIIPVLDSRINLLYERFLIKHLEINLLKRVIVICVNCENFKDYKKKYELNETIIFLDNGFNASNARNIGIEWLKAKYEKNFKDNFIWFADDDCFYPTKENFDLIKNDLESSNIILCRLKDCEKNKFVGKSFPEYLPFLNLAAFIYGAPSIITNLEIVVKFDEKIGPGSEYFAAEDSDFLLRVFPLNNFEAKISKAYLFHPLIPNNNRKLYKYGVGQGYLLRRIILGYYQIKFFTTIIFCLYLYLLRPLCGLLLSCLLFRGKYIIFYINRLRGIFKGILNLR